MVFNGSPFETFVILNNFSNWCREVNIIKNVQGFILLKNFIEFLKMTENKTVPRNSNFRCGMALIIGRLKKIGTIYRLQKNYLKKRDHDENFEDT